MLFNANSKTCQFYYVLRPTSQSLLLLILNWHWESNRRKSVDKGMFTRGKKHIFITALSRSATGLWQCPRRVLELNVCSPGPLPQYHDIFRHTLHRRCIDQFFGICSTCLHSLSFNPCQISIRSLTNCQVSICELYKHKHKQQVPLSLSYFSIYII